MKMRYPGCTWAFWGAPGLWGGGSSWAGGEEATITRGCEEAAEKVSSEGGWRVGSGLQPGKHNTAPRASGHFWSN